MSKWIWTLCLVLSMGQAQALGRCDSDLVAKGTMVVALDRAINSPEQPGQLETIVNYGQDSRYYVMVRGWVLQVLEGKESQYQAIQDESKRANLEIQISQLKQAVRLIDLE